MGGSSADEKILNYNDVVLRQSDLDILNGPYYLNDRTIEFYFSYLTTIYPSQEILLVPPSISFWITNCPETESLRDFLTPLKFPDKTLVLFPVNDNDDMSLAEGGNHWSLLVYTRHANVFVHHDSLKGMNKRYAMKLYQAVVKFMDDSSSSSDAAYLECTNSPQQVNGYDCGVYVLDISRSICCWNVSAENKESSDLWFSVVKEQVTSSSVAQMRREIIELIRQLMGKRMKSDD